ncbi:MAG TPA: hypothetical protein VLF18_00675 [Tahibacter sp.]|uniref:hypothetical protein n=1 Tax=Tahibacter sp. TaxID=2056211 RepID=UPI002B6E6A4D|nr:hypothetical protein [Tahibacter sp.]HSX58687.1 hypothetical protein [Tahibacter sp.]
MNARAALLLATLAGLAGCAPSTAPAQTAAAPPAAASAEAAPASADDPSRGGARRGTWLRAESERDELPIVWEFRDDYAAPAGLPPRLVIVSQVRDIPYVGQIDTTLRAELAGREQRLIDALAGHAELIAVLDWRLQHDWYFYGGPEVTRERVIAALGNTGGRDIKVSVETDGGEFYTALKKRVGKTP